MGKVGRQGTLTRKVLLALAAHGPMPKPTIAYRVGASCDCQMDTLRKKGLVEPEWPRRRALKGVRYQLTTEGWRAVRPIREQERADVIREIEEAQWSGVS